MGFNFDVCVVGGGGHVGLPLALTFAEANLKATIYDINQKSLELISKGVVPFKEKGAENLLKKSLKNDRLKLFSNPSVIAQSEFIIVIVGTPIDEFLNPKVQNIVDVFDEIKPYLRSGQTIILRSTIFPGTTKKVRSLIQKNNLKINLAFCPERVAEGKAIEEIRDLPQIISGFDPLSLKKARQLFGHVAKDLVELTPEEAELAKLFTNSWRYIQFAVANQFFTIAHQSGLDFYRILSAIKFKYPRAKDFPAAGFAAGPCLLKDTMQIASFSNNSFFLGHSAMLVNEGLPNYIVAKLKEKNDLARKTIGIIGMAFKAESDDKRTSLAYKLRRMLEIEAKKVLCTDVYIKDKSFYPLAEVLQKSEIIIIGCPHADYKKIKIKPKKKLVDIWNFLGQGGIF